MEYKAKINPSDADLQTQLLEYYIEKKQYKKAIKHFESKEFHKNRDAVLLYATALVRSNTVVDKFNKLMFSVRPSQKEEKLAVMGQLKTSDEQFPTPVQVALGQSFVVRWLIGSILSSAVLLLLYYILFRRNRPDEREDLSEMIGLSKGYHEATTSDVRFSDVLGIDEAKEEMQDIVSFLKNPEKYSKMGARLPKGILLIGPPGTGKTLLAKAVAGEADVPFFYTSGSDFDEMFVGVGSRKVRSLFEKAKENAPCIIFIDEIDAVGESRYGLNYSNTLNQLLTEMDGFASNSGVIVIGATNVGNRIDKALRRPGRFDKEIVVNIPDIRGRVELLKYYLRNVPTSKDVDVELLARTTTGMTGADLKNMVNRASIRAAKLGLQRVTQSVLENSYDDILMGIERKSAVMTEEARRRTAYHEGGHAIVALHLKGARPIHKATIAVRGTAPGMVKQVNKGDEYSFSQEQMLAEIAVRMGGRIAEEVIFGPDKVTSGAADDLQRATRLATSMVSQWGLSEICGKLHVDDSSKDEISDKTLELIDAEKRKLIDKQYELAKDIIMQHRKELHLLASALMERETLTAAEIEKVVKGEKLPKLI